MDLLIVIIAVVLIYTILENNKIKKIFKSMYKIDSEIEREIKCILKEDDNIDIYTLQEIRRTITNKFVNCNKLDDFNIYKESIHKVNVILKLGLAVQKLELITNKRRTQLKEVSLEYSNINFLKK